MDLTRLRELAGITAQPASQKRRLKESSAWRSYNRRKLSEMSGNEWRAKPAGRYYEILNPDFELSDSEPEFVMVDVKYDISGKYHPATFDAPEEHPDFDITAVRRVDTGEDILGKLPDGTYDALEYAVWQQVEDEREDDDDDLYESGTSYTGDADVDTEVDRMLQKSSDSFVGKDAALADVAYYLLDQGIDHIRVESIMTKIESALGGINEAAHPKMDPSAINAIAKMDLPSARARAEEMIAATDTRPEKKQYLLRQLDFARNTMAITKLLYDMLLKGEGFGVIGSKYSKRFDESSKIGTSTTWRDVLADYKSDCHEGSYDERYMDGDDFFPNGATSSVTNRVGPRGAAQGDNPMQKRAEIAETHRRLQRSYARHLKG